VALFFKKIISPVIVSKKLEDSLIKFLQKLAEPSAKQSRLKKFWEALSAPFIVTILGGIVLAGVSAVFAKCSADNTRQTDQELAALRQRQNFIDTFDNKIDQYLRLTFSLRKKEIFLDDWQSQPGRDAVKYPDGRNFFDTTLQWEQDKRYLIEHWPGSPQGLVHTGKVIFTKSETLKNFDQMEECLKKYDLTRDYPELEKMYFQVLDLVGQITSQLEGEAREEKK
jgi:hypothetical protein